MPPWRGREQLALACIVRVLVAESTTNADEGKR